MKNEKWIPNKEICERYAKRIAEHSHYGVMGMTSKKIKSLSEQEFGDGKPGIAYLDIKQNKLVFKKTKDADSD